MTSADALLMPDPVMLAYVRAPARPGLRMLAVDDLPIIDRPTGVAEAAAVRWPLPLVVSQASALAGGHLEGGTGNIVCELCGSVLAQRIVWSGGPGVIGLVRGHRWSRARSWGKLPKSAVVAARHRAQWFCLLDQPTTPAHLPLACRTHGPLSVSSADVRAAPSPTPLAVKPPGCP